MAPEFDLEPIDETQLTGDTGEIYLFQWLSSLHKRLKEAHLDQVKASQPFVEETLLKIICGSDNYPLPGHGIRNLSARCLVLQYNRGETKTLFDVFRALLKIAGDAKATDKDSIRIATYWTIGELMAVFGSQFMSFAAEITTISLKTFRSSNSPHMRFHALTMLRKTLESAKRALTDALTKDTIKQMKNGLGDKALPVQRAAAGALIVMFSPEETVSLVDVESIITACVRSLDSSDQVTRQALAQLVGHVLAATQVPRAIPTVEPHKGKKEAESSDASVPAYVASEHLKPLLLPSEMLSQVSSHFNKTNLSRKARAGIFDFYFALLAKLGRVFVENDYALIVGHLMSEVVSNPRNGATRYDKLFTRKLIGALLRDLIATRALSEQGQVGAIQELSSSYLKRWPALMPGQVSPSSTVLTIALAETAELLQMLGNAPPVVQDAVAEPLLNLLTHPSHSVRVNASWALRCFCFSTPLRLPKSILSILESLNRDIQTLLSPAAPSGLDRRALGRAYGLAALVATIPDRPLYVSFDVASNVLDTATQLLKRASEHDVRVAGVEVEVAWILIASLMLLGPNFVRSRLPQLLVLWRNALPKVSTKDSSSGRTSTEWEFLLHVRESALGAILCFLLHDNPLVTLDVARRISSMLSNALAFTTAITSQIVELPVSPVDTGEPSLRTRECLLRCRVYQCFTALGTSALTESTRASLLQSTMAMFAGPEGGGMSAIQASIASSSGTFTSVWQTADGFGYGVTTIHVADDEHDALSQATRTETEQVEELTTLLLRKPVLGAREHDTLSLCLNDLPGTDEPWFDPPPPPSAVVDAAIELFARLLPAEDLTVVTRTVTQLCELARSPRLDKNTGRKAAVSVNTTVAVVRALRLATIAQYRQAKETLGNVQVATLLEALLKDTLVDGDPLLRRASSEAIGRLANISGTTFLTSQAKGFVDHILNNRDPQGRAGCALAFGALYSHVGGLGAAPILKTAVNILMSLSNDPHPLVHFWSLTALARVINAASLAFSPFVPSTLGMLLKIYMSEAHEAEGGTLNNVNIGGDLHAFPVVCRIIDAIITILGPDIHESLKTRSLVLDLVQEFSLKENEDILVQAIKCTQHLLMFAPDSLDIPDIVTHFRVHLASSKRQLKLAAIDALYQLVQKDALVMSRLGGDGLVEDLFAMLDGDPDVHGVKSVIKSWLSQTAIHNPSAWIDLCQRIMLRTNTLQKTVNTVHNVDDEGQSLNASMSVGNAAQEESSSIATSRWRTQLFALECLHDVCTAVACSQRKEHVNILFAKNSGLPVHGLLFSRVPDLIKMAFTASTAYVTEIRLEGLVVLRDIIQIFSKTPDPDYPEALLLEQHQAPITAALTPAFSSDSTPEILSSAIDACALFVGCGVVKDLDRMGRILKQLTSSLEEANESGNLKMETLGELSPNASGMLRISILAAWARLEIASAKQAYLLDVVKPYRQILASQWVGCLRDYAIIRADSEFVHDTSLLSLDPSFVNLGKAVLLPYYSDVWATILKAIANAMGNADESVAAAITGRDSSSASNVDDLTSPRSEPAPLFYVIFGLIYEALATPSTQPTTGVDPYSDPVVACLEALKFLISPCYSGRALLEFAVFKEFFGLCYRMAMVENARPLVHLLEVVHAFDKFFGHHETGSVLAPNEVLPQDSIHAHCLKLSLYILRHTRRTQGAPAISGSVQELTKVVSGALGIFELVASTLDGDVREDVRSTGAMLYAELLKDETLDMDLITPTLPALKSLLSVEIWEGARERYNKLIHGLLSSCLLNIDEMQGREGPICSRKVNVNMLAAVLILTSVPPRVKFVRGAVEHLAHLISQKLEGPGDIAMIAAHCAKTVTIAAAGSDLLRSCVQVLLPSLVQFVARTSPRLDDDSLSEQQCAAVEEVYKTFAALLVLVPEENRTRVLCIILPTVTLLLRPGRASLSGVHSGAVSQLLAFAASSPASFKEAVTQLDPKVREVLEQSIRKAVESTPVIAQTVTKPQISLRSF